MPITLKKGEQQDQMREEISTTLKAEIKEEQLLEITKLQAQMKATLIEPEDLQNRTMRSTLIFKNIPVIQNGKILPGSWLTSLHVSWISHILLKKFLLAHRRRNQKLHN